MVGQSQKPFLHFVIDPGLLKRIDDFRFRRRFPTRSQAIITLIEAGLKVSPEKASKPATVAAGKHTTN